MNAEHAHLLESALSLPDRDRARLAASLIESLDTELDDELEITWQNEIARRIQELDSGAVSAVDWDTARRQILR